MVVYLETFMNFQDASSWVERHLDEHPPGDWELVECRINLLGGLYRAGVSFRKRSPSYLGPIVVEGSYNVVVEGSYNV
jgi:hypothetical protein